MSDQSGYRIDIEATRGIAIAGVFAYHLWPAILPSGFLGVDLFFVISGYLMASVYDIASIGPWSFYFRRARRILPAYYAIIALVLLAGTLRLLPQELADLDREAVFSAGLLGNVGAWSISNYFNASYFQPLLHLWSLGVEAQFYLVFPLVAWLWRRSPWAAGLGFALSLAACLLAAHVSPKTAFFLTPFRLWEFGAGFLAAKAAKRWPAATGHPVWSWLGPLSAAVMVGAMFLSLRENQHPGPAAMAVSLAGAVLLLVGLPRRVLSSTAVRVAAWLGKYSYSVYLVHYPLIVFVLHRPFSGGQLAPASAATTLVLIAATLAAALALYHGVEAPLRRARPRQYWRWQALVAAMAVFGMVAAPAAQARTMDGSDRAVFSAWSDRGPYRCGKWARVVHPAAKSCELVKGESGRPVLLLVGNSHADAAKEALGAAARDDRAGLWMMADNCSLGEAGCSPDQVAREARSRGAATIVLHASPSGVHADAVAQLVTLAERQGLGVVFVDPVPVWRDSVLQTLYLARRGAAPERQSLAAYEASNAAAFAVLDRIRSPVFRRVRTGPLFCTPQCAMVEADGRPLYFDTQHLTLTGAERFRRSFEAIASGSPAAP